MRIDQRRGKQRYQPIQELRDLTQSRTTLKQEPVRIGNRIRKVLEELADALSGHMRPMQDGIHYRSFAAAVLAGCALALPQNGQAQSPVTYTGEATAVSVSVLGLVHTSISNTGPLPASGGSLSRSLLTFQLPGILDLGLLTASTAGANNQTTARASVANVELTVAGVYVTAEVLTSNATAACDPGSATASGTSTISSSGSMLVNALHLKVNGITDVAISTSEAGVACSAPAIAPE